METPVTGTDLEHMGTQLKQLRKSHGFKSQEKLAEYLNLSKDTIYNYENGKTAIPHEIIKKLCIEFHVSADYFYFDYDISLKNGQRKDGNDVDRILMEKIGQYDEFEKRKIIDMIDVMFRERSVI